MGQPREAVKKVAKMLGLFETIRDARDGTYIALRDNPTSVEVLLYRSLQGASWESIRRLSGEFDDLDLVQTIDEQVKAERLVDKSYLPGFSTPLNLRGLYILCRSLRPAVAVETGVASGASSLVILTAMQKNQAGMLYSIDLPPQEWADVRSEYRKIDGVSLPNNKRPGWLVPEELKSRWKLLLGDSKTELPKLLSELQTIQLFYHDAEHTYEAMHTEYKSVWPHLATGGVLASDDVVWNSAFKEFVAEIGAGGVGKRWFAFGLIHKR